jgi:hypothetical protein
VASAAWATGSIAEAVEPPQPAADTAIAIDAAIAGSSLIARWSFICVPNRLIRGAALADTGARPRLWGALARPPRVVLALSDPQITR